jgi:hypothetical protein
MSAVSLAAVREEWRAALMSVAEIDKLTACIAVGRVYLASGYQPPHQVRFFASPWRALEWRCANLAGCEMPSLFPVMRRMVFSAFIAQLDKAMHEKIATDLWYKLHWAKTGVAASWIESALRLSGIPRNLIRVPDALGNQDAYWLASYDFARRSQLLQLPPEVDAWFSAYCDYARLAGWLYPFETVALVVERPSHIEMDDRGRLHGRDGPAIVYRDGTGIFAWHGCPVPRWSVLDRDRLNPTTIRMEPDDTLRRTLFEMWAGETS